MNMATEEENSIEKIQKDTNNRDVEEYFEKQLERTNYWLSFAEAKNGGLLAFNIALIGVLFTVFDECVLLCSFLIILAIISSIFSIISFCPVLNKLKLRKTVKGEGLDRNLIFYYDIASYDCLDDYINSVSTEYFNNKIIENKRIRDLAYEVYENSKITIRKYELFKIAISINLVSLTFFIFFIICA